MAEAVLQVLVEKLSSLISEGIGSIVGADDEMKKLLSNFTNIQGVLEDAEMKQIERRAIQDWLVKLNHLTYEIDDILDECTTEISKLERRSSRYSFHLKKILLRSKIGRRIKRVAEKLDAVAAEREKFHLREMVVQKPIEYGANTRETGSIMNESHHVFGREEDTEKIVQILVNQVKDNQEISVLPIIGIGGLGKTTLAQLVFKDERVVDHFEQKLWVCVSDNFDLKTLLRAMIESVDRNAPDLVHLDALQRRLWELVNGKRYLIVLDDVWNEDQEEWSKLRNVLACGSIGSSIIVTTRLRKVADIMGTLQPHYLTGLSQEHCWLLLQDRAFGQEEKGKYPDLEAIGKQIVKKCGGVPLAAKALGGLLRFKRTEKDWVYVNESEIWELPQDQTLILPALKLSYHHLPLEMRRCFVYCAVFPKDSKIKKKELVFLWMAHGYISSKGVLEVEDVGNDICNELALRSLLQYVPYGKTKSTLIMHDLVHDLAQSIMENKIPGTRVRGNAKSTFDHSKIRQVNLYKKSVAFPTMSDQSEMDMSFILTNFCRLRSLDASWTSIKDLPSAIGNLKHLRQLNLSNTEIVSLPDSVCSLWNLQVLNLCYCSKLVALPKKTRQLVNLRHLVLERCTSLKEMPSKIRELSCLRTLTRFIVGHKRGNQLEELQWLNLVGGLRIHHLERVQVPMDAKKANLAEKKNIQRLILNWSHDNASKSVEGINKDEKVLEELAPNPNLEKLEIHGFSGRYFPVWMASSSALQRVVRIDISDCENCLLLPQLGKLTHLKRLSLCRLALVEYIMEEDEQVDEISGSLNRQHFPSLEILKLRSLPNLKGFSKEQVSTEAFSNLEELWVDDCSSLVVLPPVVHLKKLKRLRCSSLTLVSLSKLELHELADVNVEMDGNMTCIPVETLRNLTNIKSLRIRKADELCFPAEEGLRALNNCLTELEIHDSADTLKCVPEGWLRDLTALEYLKISDCSELVELPDGIFKHDLNFVLKRVCFSSLPKMVVLPKALQQLSSSLQSLRLYCLHNLESLPDWLDRLTSLESLEIYNCPKIASIPDCIRGMPNLQYLYISDCIQLEKRCERGKGEDWFKVAHIPRLLLMID